MPNPFFEAMNRGGTAPVNQASPMNAAKLKQSLMNSVQAFKKNPMAFIIQTKYNIPANLLGDPDGMLDYLLQTKQVSPSYIDWVKQRLAQQGLGR